MSIIEEIGLKTPLTGSEAAEILKIPRGQVYRFIKDGTIKSFYYAGYKEPKTNLEAILGFVRAIKPVQINNHEHYSKTTDPIHTKCKTIAKNRGRKFNQSHPLTKGGINAI
ncbi:MAG: helix-turn-helix domain-containing protein [Candidatus Kapabacteria bacterium]|nr:helix-turn-helix domain-containing protein [Candidatus Kapabacteria bacterium]